MLYDYVKNQITGSTFLQAQLLQNIFKLRVFRNVRNLKMNSGAHPGAQVAGAGENVPQVGVPHVLVAGRLHVRLNQLQAFAPPVKDLVDVSSFLH